MTTIILGVAVFVIVIVTLVVGPHGRQVQTGGVGRRHDHYQRGSRQSARDTGRRHPAQHPGREQDLHPVGVRRQGHLRGVQGGGPRRGRRPAAHRNIAHQPRRGAPRDTVVVPGQGQAGHEDRGRAGDLQRPQVALPRAVQSQCRDLHQGTGSRVARGRGGAVPRRRLHPDRVSAVRGPLQGLRYRGGVSGGLGQVQRLAVHLQGGRGRDPGLLHGQLPGRNPTSSCST